MTNRVALRRLFTAVLLLICAGLPARSYSQEPASSPEAWLRTHTEGEFTASTLFQAGYFDVRVVDTSLLIDTRFYGVEIHDVGVAGLAWELKLHRLRLMPGLGWAVGQENKPAPVVTARWSFEAERWLSQGHLLQSFHEHVTEVRGEGIEHAAASTHSVVLEGHASARVGHFEVGALAEHVRYRAEHEWKSGGRAAWRLGHGVKLSTEMLAPHFEVRGGLAWEP